MAERNYVLGRGKVYFDRFAAGTRARTGERYLGNTPSFSLTVESEDLDHMSSDEGINVIDDSVLLSVSQSGEVAWEDINKDNLALFFLGEAVTVTQTATPVTGENLGTVQEDRYYQLGVTDANPAGVRDVSAVALKQGATPLVEGTDYRLEAELARVYIPKGSAAAGKAVTADYTPAAVSRDRVISGRESVYGALRFIAANPKGKNVDYLMPYVKLSPNGDFSLKGDEWQQGSFSIKIMEPAAGMPAIYADGRPYTP